MPRLFSKNFLVHLLAKKFQLQIKLKNCLKYDHDNSVSEEDNCVSLRVISNKLWSTTQTFYYFQITLRCEKKRNGSNREMITFQIGNHLGDL